MRHFGAVIRIDMILMVHGGHHGSMSRIITSQFVGHQPARFTVLAFEQATEKPFGCLLIAATLHQYINDIAVLIDSTPQILALPLNGDKDFINMPGIA